MHHTGHNWDATYNDASTRMGEKACAEDQKTRVVDRMTTASKKQTATTRFLLQSRLAARLTVSVGSRCGGQGHKGANIFEGLES